MLDKVVKQPYEEFTVSVDFSPNMETGETINAQTVTAVDKDGNPATDTVTDQNTVQAIDQSVACLIKGGIEAGSKYKLTYRATTSNSHKWEKDIYLEIKEL